jgi:hypothetical protein
VPRADETWVDETWVDETWVDETWVDETWVDETWVDETWVGVAGPRAPSPSSRCSMPEEKAIHGLLLRGRPQEVPRLFWGDARRIRRRA